MNGSFLSKHLSQILGLVLLVGLFTGVRAENQVNRLPADVKTGRALPSEAWSPSSPSPQIQTGESTVNLWNVIVQTLILGVIFFYTYQTRKMQLAMVRQIKLSVMPSFTLELAQLNVIDSTLEVNSYALQITNVGSGTALNIEIQPILLSHLVKGRRKVGSPNLKFSRLGLLRPDGTAVLKHQSFSGEQLVEEDYIIDLEDSLIRHEGSGKDLTVLFKDIEGDNYRQKIRLTSTGCEPEAVMAR